ncbi:flagellar biosynthetic protein FliO [Aestuariivirga sp.]|uniref:flagellar biosynthetic protein FliO n=1 Tax=Aestuariivirga sp. TaxID=2650926 RepID=UPI0025BDDE84|nr:flagellar biosynthetic protein FliO [Aestuariivirga sp.]MCA3554058.1 flagellar biosynthetic protein FliO [Aestuariivirga sp.]
MDFLNENMNNIILAVAILLILAVLLAAWRAFSPRVSGGRRGQRLGISEYYSVDKDRRLVLVRRDNVEHLILIGGPQDVVIEGGIGSPGGQPPHPLPPRRDPAQPGAARPAPRAPVFKTEPIGKSDPGPGAPPPTRKREEPEL